MSMFEVQAVVREFAKELNRNHASNNRVIDEIAALQAEQKRGYKRKIEKLDEEREATSQVIRRLEVLAWEIGVRRIDLYNEMERAWQEDYSVSQRKGVTPI